MPNKLKPPKKGDKPKKIKSVEGETRKQRRAREEAILRQTTDKAN